MLISCLSRVRSAIVCGTIENIAGGSGGEGLELETFDVPVLGGGGGNENEGSGGEDRDRPQRLPCRNFFSPGYCRARSPSLFSHLQPRQQ